LPSLSQTLADSAGEVMSKDKETWFSGKIFGHKSYNIASWRTYQSEAEMSTLCPFLGEVFRARIDSDLSWCSDSSYRSWYMFFSPVYGSIEIQIRPYTPDRLFPLFWKQIHVFLILGYESGEVYLDQEGRCNVKNLVITGIDFSVGPDVKL